MIMCMLIAVNVVLLYRPPAGSISSAQLLQAVVSFTHFSQIRAWMVTNGGHLPFELLYR